MSGVSSTMPSIPPSVSQSNSFSNSSSLSKSVRNEAMKVLEIKGNDDADTSDVNQPFNVRRTESGGFRCNDIQFVTSWKSARMSFSNSKFRDYLGGEELENFYTAGPAG